MEEEGEEVWGGSTRAGTAKKDNKNRGFVGCNMAYYFHFRFRKKPGMGYIVVSELPIGDEF